MLARNINIEILALSIRIMEIIYLQNNRGWCFTEIIHALSFSSRKEHIKSDVFLCFTIKETIISPSIFKNKGPR